MSDVAGLHVTLTTTAGFVPHVAAAVASLREHNSAVPVSVFVDEPTEQLSELAEVLSFRIQVVPVNPRETAGINPADVEMVRSRLVKIHSMATATAPAHLYLDSDTLLRGDIGGISDDVGVRLDGDADVFMLLRRPVPPPLWKSRHQYFTDPDIDRAGAVALMNDTFGMTLPPSIIDDLVCWNSGVIFGSAAGMRRMGERWLELYRKTLRTVATGQLIPRDQLSMWLALWEMRQELRVAELPVTWNFMAGHLLDLPVGTEEVSAGRLTPAVVLHFAQNKSDPWARRLVDEVLVKSGIAEILAGTSSGS